MICNEDLDRDLLDVLMYVDAPNTILECCRIIGFICEYKRSNKCALIIINIQNRLF